MPVSALTLAAVLTKQQKIAELEIARQDWLLANGQAVEEAQTYLTKKGNFNPPLEKPWPKWEALRVIANEKWYIYYNLLQETK